MFSAHAGVGGISGGHINFQRNSTFVNALYSKTLCHDTYEFRTMSMICKKWSSDSDRECILKVLEEITQPLESTRERCKERSDRKCVEWETIRFYQSPDRTIKILDDSRNVIKIKKLTIPICR